MIWLQSPPWTRWIAALVIAAGALWIEVRPEPMVAHPFANEEIRPGTVVDETNTESREVPIDTLEPVALGETAVRLIPIGNPVLASDVGTADEVVPTGWWMLEIPLPRTAQIGDASRIVLLDSGTEIAGVVVAPAVDDPLGSGLGMVAVEPDHAGETAKAVAEGRVAVMVAP